MQRAEEYAKRHDELDLQAGASEVEEGEIDWLGISHDAFTQSDSFFGSSIANQIEKNLSMFNSRHAAGSKYNTPSYKFRSKIFRPKIRSTVRRHEAAASGAFFATEELAICKAENSGDDTARAGARIGENLLNIRLRSKAMQWFLTCLGAYQDAMAQGVVISREEWIYRERDVDVPGGFISDTQGQRHQRSETVVLEDRPSIDLVPVENFRFDPNADWRDPVEDSPYLIEMIPMYRGDVKANMNEESKDLSKHWFDLSDEELSTSTRDTYATEGIRDRRNENREDPTDETYIYRDFDLIWVHRNIIRMDDEDWLFYTLGTTALLSEPILLEEIYPHGRLYTMGFCNLETHKTHPAAPIEMLTSLQAECNDIANQRLDNVKLVINRRSFVRRNAKVDTRGLTQSVPGGVTLVDDVNADVRYDAPPDVTQSSYQEQDRLNSDFDELAGSFSSSSVGSNRAMNETVGGMEILTADATNISEYQLRIFTETWVKPVLEKILRLEQIYESDEEMLQVASGGMPTQEALKALQSKLIVKVNVGVGATSPQRKIEKLSLGLQTLGNFIPAKLEELNHEEITKEVFGALGYQDGSRFFKEGETEDPRIKQLQGQLQELQDVIKTKQIEQKGKVDVANIKGQSDIAREEIRKATLLEVAQITQDIEYINSQIDAEKNDIKRGSLIIERDAFQFNKDIKENELAVGDSERMSALLMRNDYGLAPGVEEKSGRG